MKKFKFSYSAPVLALIIAGMAVAVISVILNVIRILNVSTPTTYNYVSLISVVAVCAVYMVLAVSMLVNSYYAVDEKYFTLCWGILKNQIEIRSITRVLLNSEKHKLTIFFNQDNYFEVKSKTISLPDLVSVLREGNDKIVIDFTSDGGGSNVNG